MWLAISSGRPAFPLLLALLSLLPFAASAPPALKPSRQGRSLNAPLLRNLTIPWQQNLTTDVWTPPLAGEDNVVTVYTTIAFNKVNNLDVITATFYADFYIYLAWRDDRFLAAAQALGEPGDGASVCIQDDPAEPVSPVCIPGGWVVDPEAMNAKDPHVAVGGTFTLSHGAPIWVGEADGSAAEGAWLTGWARCAGPTDSLFNMVDFPFDTQSAPLMFESRSLDDNFLRFVAAPSLVATALPPAAITLDGWRIDGVTASVVGNMYLAFGQAYSRLIVSVNVTRKPSFFLSKYVLVVTLIFGIALASGTISHRAPDRVTLTVSAGFGVVSMLFVLASQMPVLGYSTRMDQYFTLTFICVSALVVYNAARIKWDSGEPTESGQRVAGAAGGGDGGAGGGDRAALLMREPPAAPRLLARKFAQNAAGAGGAVGPAPEELGAEHGVGAEHGAGAAPCGKPAAPHPLVRVLNAVFSDVGDVAFHGCAGIAYAVGASWVLAG